MDEDHKKISEMLSNKWSGLKPKSIQDQNNHGENCKDFYFTHFDSPGDLFSEGTEYIEIIGNIYENPIKWTLQS